MTLRYPLGGAIDFEGEKKGYYNLIVAALTLEKERKDKGSKKRWRW